jgi:hypothetical protein
VYENGVLRKIFGSKKGDVTGDNFIMRSFIIRRPTVNQISLG